jgi:hypothetical protein
VLDKLDGALHILEEGGAVGFDVQRDAVALRGGEDGLDEVRAFDVVFETPACVEGETFEAVVGRLLREGIGFGGGVDTSAAADAEVRLRASLMAT